MSAPRLHPWRLVAPWYCWDLAAEPDPERAAAARRPAIQKFGRDSFIEDFLRDPQPSLGFTDDDKIQDLKTAPLLPVFGSGPNAGKRRQLSRRSSCPTDTLKLFQAAHQRFYLVAFELHCDAPGFPCTDPAAVGEVGFVVRRRVSSVPAGNDRVLAEKLAGLAGARAKAGSEARLEAARERTRLLVPLRSTARLQVTEPRAATTAAFREVTLAKRRLAEWSREAGVTSTVQQWVPGAAGAIGAWLASTDKPTEITERVYPMFRLAADPQVPEHAARSGTIYFGLVPTSSEEAEEDGTPRFDDGSLYEIRCFARPADTGCPEPLVWSEASAPFGLAGFYDPAGCANRPVNIRMPDFARLSAAGSRPTVRMSTPANSHLMFPTDKVPPGSGTVSAAEEICFFAIPLIMIVAFFLLNLFLPILMLVFGLWWMLRLKFCIPPSAELGAAVNVELAAIPGQLGGAAGIDIDVFPGVDQAKLRDTLRAGLNDSAEGLGDRLTERLTNNAIVQALLVQGLGTRGTQNYPGALPTVARVERHEVVHP